MNEDSSSPTLKDVAEAAGVSVASVSKVLNNRGGVGDESRRKILDQAERLGYLGRSVRSLIKAGVENIVLVTPTEYYNQSSFYEDVIRGVLNEARANAVRMDVRLISLDPLAVADEINDILIEVKPDALILLGLDHPQVIERLVEDNIPAVIVNGMDRTMRLSCVLPDNWSAGWLATQTLLEAGHREIMHITSPHRLSLRRRLEGFRVALEEAGVAFEYDRHVFDLGRLGAQESETPRLIRRAIESGRFATTTAFFCSTDVVALGVIQGLQGCGLSVPTDYSIIGIDDIAIAQHSRPPLTTMRIDRAELGRVGAQLLLERIADPQINVRRINTGVRLVERDSIAQPRRSAIK